MIADICMLDPIFEAFHAPPATEVKIRLREADPREPGLKFVACRPGRACCPMTVERAGTIFWSGVQFHPELKSALRPHTRSTTAHIAAKDPEPAGGRGPRRDEDVSRSDRSSCRARPRRARSRSPSFGVDPDRIFCTMPTEADWIV